MLAASIKFNLILLQCFFLFVLFWMALSKSFSKKDLSSFDSLQLLLDSSARRFNNTHFQKRRLQIYGIIKWAANYWGIKYSLQQIDHESEQQDGWNHAFEFQHAYNNGSGNMFWYAKSSDRRHCYDQLYDDWLLSRMAAWIISSQSWF